MTENEATARRLIREAFNAGNLEAVDELVSPEFIEHQSLGPGAPAGRDAPKAISVRFGVVSPIFPGNRRRSMH